MWPHLASRIWRWGSAIWYASGIRNGLTNSQYSHSHKTTDHHAQILTLLRREFGIATVEQDLILYLVERSAG